VHRWRATSTRRRRRDKWFRAIKLGNSVLGERRCSHFSHIDPETLHLPI
jgi:hypothetical protein